MHCETTVDQSATWRESWRALERGYAEGRLLSIGVSNFNEELLKEAIQFGSIVPHVIQNWAEVGSHLDMPVRELCFRHHIIYQPYASIRNVQFMDASVRQQIQSLAKKYKVSEHAISLQLFLQSGASIIPRATKVSHLLENIHLLDWSLSQQDMKLLGWNSEFIQAHNNIVLEEL